MKDEPDAQPLKPEREFLPDGRVLTYPLLPKEEMAFCKTTAKGIHVSRHSFSWAFYHAQHLGDFSKFHKLAVRIAQHKPLEVMIELDPEDAA